MPVSVCEDIVYTYQITPIVAPEVMTDATLAAIPGAMPELKAGAVVDVTGTVEAISAYYAASYVFIKKSN